MPISEEIAYHMQEQEFRKYGIPEESINNILSNSYLHRLVLASINMTKHDPSLSLRSAVLLQIEKSKPQNQLIEEALQEEIAGKINYRGTADINLFDPVIGVKGMNEPISTTGTLVASSGEENFLLGKYRDGQKDLFFDNSQAFDNITKLFEETRE